MAFNKKTQSMLKNKNMARALKIENAWGLNFKKHLVFTTYLSMLKSEKTHQVLKN